MKHDTRDAGGCLPVLAASRQLLVVRAAGWDSTQGILCRFQRSTVKDGWKSQGEAIAVSLGRTGLAWGLGLHPETTTEQACKAEGDGRAPAGIFALTALFGTAAADSLFAQSARLPYLCATGDLKCVDDPASRHYNRIVDRSALADCDWSSAEDMLRADTRYAIGAVIAHNVGQRPGAGSCIFLHVWQSPGVPTTGCTAAALDDVLAICGWLDAAASPLLVQLPEAEYARFRSHWALP